MLASFASEVAFTALQVLYLFAPLLVSSVLSGIVLRFDLAPWLRKPIDGGLSLRGHRLFGHSKTWRGVVVAVVGSMATVVAQKALGTRAAAVSVIDYENVNAVWFGAAMGAGAMLGELPNSFVKRQLGIAPGGTARGARAVVFYIWDQVDLLTGAWPLLLPWIRPSVRLVVASFLVVLAIHPLVAFIGYLVKARPSPR